MACHQLMFLSQPVQIQARDFGPVRIREQECHSVTSVAKITPALLSLASGAQSKASTLETTSSVDLWPLKAPRLASCCSSEPVVHHYGFYNICAGVQAVSCINEVWLKVHVSQGYVCRCMLSPCTSGQRKEALIVVLP